MSSNGTSVPYHDSPGGQSHIVWDWNGTLLDDSDAVVVAVNRVCAQFGVPPITLTQWRAMYQRPLLGVYERLLRRPLSQQDWVRLEHDYHDAYREQLGQLRQQRSVESSMRLAAGVPYVLDDWRAAGGSQSLLSMWFHTELVPLIDQLRLSEFFSRVDGLPGDVGGGSKAEHLATHLAVQQLDPGQVVVIGDVADDARAAAEVGAGCVLVATGMMSRDRLASAGVPVVESISEAVNSITL